MEQNKHLFTRETIFHFTCSECKNWWSYASEAPKILEELAVVGRNSHFLGWEMTCPHCGVKNKVKMNE